jgi:hypothetical protein
LSKEHPKAWESVNIKKTFLPKLYQTLDNAGYGAPNALYENFVKFLSIFPFMHVDNYKEDKQNKASFKERCNIIREIFKHLYLGIMNDDAPTFH